MVMFRDYDADLKKEMERTSIHLSKECMRDLEKWADSIAGASGRKLLDLDGLKYYNSRLNERFKSIEDRIDRLESALSANEKRELLMSQLNASNQQQTNYEHELLMAQLNASNRQQMYNICDSLNAANQQQMYNIRETLNAALQNYERYKVDV